MPSGTDGTVTPHVKLPLLSEVQVELAATPSSLNVIGCDATNPAPVAVVVLPTMPVVGLRESDAFTSYVADALFVPSEATIGCGPWGAEGIDTVQVKLPLPLDEQVDEAASPARVNVIGLLGSKPLPVAVVVLPTTPLVGLRAREASTENVAVALFVPSEATIGCAPFGTAGIVTTQENPPLALDVQGEAAATPSSLKVMACEARKPAPAAFVVLPTTPLVGLRARDGSTVKVAEALFVPSDATIGWAPFGTLGIVTEHEKLPLALDVQVEDADTPANLNAIEWLARNPVPVAVVVLATVPEVGERETNAPIVKDPGAMTVPSGVVLAEIGWVPAGAPGTRMVQTNEPLAATSIAPSLHEELAPPKYGVTDAPEVNPEPLSVTSLPTMPLEGLNANAGSTVKFSVARTVPSLRVFAEML